MEVGGKIILHYSMKAVRGCRGIAPLILNLGTRWGRMGNLPQHLPRGESPLYPYSEWGLGAGLGDLEKMKFGTTLG